MSNYLRTFKIFFPAVVTAAILLLPIIFVTTAHAQALNGNTGGYNGSTGGYNGSTGGYNGSTGGSSNTLQNPLGVCSISDLIALLLKAAIAIGIPIAVLFIVWAGFKFILARGSPGELTEARANLVATLIGIAIFIGASLIANVIISTLHQLGVQGVSPISASNTSSCP